MPLNNSLFDAPRDMTLVPFWFWNDLLDPDEIRRQIQDFQDHGVHGFVLHPRVGLPRTMAFMSRPLLDMMRVAIDAAAERGMVVMLYDEGMYPSGAASGLVVERHPHLACRGLVPQILETGDEPALESGWKLMAEVSRQDGSRLAVIDRPVDSVIRGLHYIGDGPAEDEPPMSDLLNPQTTEAVLSIVYDVYFEAFGEHFGKAIIAIFTDEPHALGRCRERQARPGTTGILGEVERLLGYDFTPHLACLWHDDEPDAHRHRANYQQAIRERMQETWYAPLGRWCEQHGVALTGHPASGDESGPLQHFQMPGQDLVWRWVEPGKPTGIEGPESTQGKVSASAMVHDGRRRNGNEFCGAYGHELTFEEMKALADWCLVRGVNLLIPHAFYYSVRGPRRDERPPQLGPHGRFWDRFKPFADYCRRMCWLNTDAVPEVRVAILTGPDACPWWSAKACLEHQHDFHYLEFRHLLSDAKVTPEGLRIGDMTYAAVVEDADLTPPAEVEPVLGALREADRLAVFQGDEAGLVSALDRLLPRTVRIDPAVPALRVRRLTKDGHDLMMLFNESDAALSIRIADARFKAGSLIDVFREQIQPWQGEAIDLGPFETRVLLPPT